MERVRDAELVKLKEKLQQTHDNRQRAVIFAKMEAVREKYWDDWDRLSDKIHKAKMKLIDCCS